MRNARQTLPRSLLLASVIALSLSGCATQQAVTHMNTAVTTKAEQDFETSRTPTQATNFAVDNSFYAAKSPIDVTPVNPHVDLPPLFSRPANVNVQTRVTLQELASNISSGSGVRVVLASDVTTPVGGANGQAGLAGLNGLGGANGMNPTAVPPSGLPPLPTNANAAAAQNANTPYPNLAPATGVTTGLTVDGFLYKGNLSGLLDSLSTKFGLSWRWDGNQIVVFRYETRMFRIAALAGDSTVNATLSTQAQSSSGSGGSGGGGGGGSSGGSGGSNGITGNSGQNTTVNTKLAIWDDVEKAIKATKSQGGTYSMVPSAGLVTVHDTPTVLDEIATEMKAFNQSYSKTVILKVDVYSVENTNEDSYGMDWNIFWSAASKSGIKLGQTGTTNTSSGTSGTANPSFTFTQNGGPFSGSNVIASALSTMGKTTLVTSVQAVTLNGQTVPVNVSRQQAYLQSYSTTLNGGVSGASTTTLTPGVVTEGFSMNFTPRIMDDNGVMMRYAVDLSSIENIATFTSPDGTSSIQLPTVDVRDFLQNVKIKSGESLMLTGLQQVQGTDNGSGPFSPKAWFLGGNRASTDLNRTIVIIVTPYIVQ
jgi:type IVB pilus formation R64 PilN family outer membrane protein